jgi:hypothetical protein
MIFLLTGVLLLTAWRFTALARRRGLVLALRGEVARPEGYAGGGCRSLTNSTHPKPIKPPLM